MEGFGTRRGLVPALGLVFVTSIVLLVATFAVPWFGAAIRATGTADPATTWYDRGELSTRAVTDGAVSSGTEGNYLRGGVGLATSGLVLAAAISAGWIGLRLVPFSRTTVGGYANAALAAALAATGALVAGGGARFVGYMIARLSDGATTSKLQAAGLLWAVSIPGLVLLLAGLALTAFGAYVALHEAERGLGSPAPPRRGASSPRRLLFYGATAALVGAAVLNVLPWTSLNFNAADSTGALVEARFTIDRGRLEALSATAPGGAFPAGGIAYTAVMQGTIRDMLSNLDLARSSFLYGAIGLVASALALGLLEQGRATISARIALVGSALVAGLTILVGLGALVSAVLHVGDLNDALVVSGAPATTGFAYTANPAPFLALVVVLAFAAPALIRATPPAIQNLLERAHAAETGRESRRAAEREPSDEATGPDQRA